jgi:hypothetical protein
MIGSASISELKHDMAYIEKMRDLTGGAVNKADRKYVKL